MMNIICRHHPHPTTGYEVSEPVCVAGVRRGLLRGRVRSSLCMPRVTGGRELSAAGVAAGACTFFALYAASHWWA